jgi:hypothetical protein
LQLQELKVAVPGGRLAVTGGTIHGLSSGSILAVYKNPRAEGDNQRAEGDEPRGYVKINQCSAIESIVAECDKNGQPADTGLTEGVVQIAMINYSYLRPMVFGIDAINSDAPPELAKKVQSLGEEKGVFPKGLVQMQESSADAHWLVQTTGRNAYLVPSSGWSVAASPSSENPAIRVPGSEYGPFALDDEEQLKRLATNIGAIAKAQNLLRLAPPPDGSKLISGPVNVHLDVRRHESLDDKVGKSIDFSTGAPTINPGELIGFHVTNKGRSRIDVTLLYVDAGYGITPWFPAGNEVGNRLSPGETLGPPFIARADITAETTGLEHLVMIAVEANGPPIDFTWLAQPGVVRQRGDSPFRDFNDLLTFAVARDGTRGARPAEAGGVSYVMRTISWTVPTAREE